MKLIAISVLTFISICCYAQGTWTELNAIIAPQPASQLPHERTEASGFSIGGIGYILTGYNDDNTFHYLDDLHSYDPAVNRWHPLASVPAPARSYAYGGAVNGKGFLTMGSDDTGSFNDTWEYDPAANLWTQKNNFPGTSRKNGFSYSIGGKFYIGGGNDYLVMLSDLWEFDPAANIWNLKNPLPFGPRKSSGSFSIQTYGYIVGGIDSTNTWNNLSWRYDPIADSWTAIAPFPGIAATCAFALSDSGYILQNTNLYIYDPLADSWSSRGAPLIPSLGNAIPFSYNNEEYLMCRKRNVIKYNPSADTWTEVYKSPSDRHDVGYQAFVIGDTAYFNDWKYDYLSDIWLDDFHSLNSNWLFAIDSFIYSIDTAFQKHNPSTNNWMQCSPFPLNSFEFYFSVDGKGYVYGDMIDSLGNYVKEFWAYDPINDQWSRKNDFPGINRTASTGFSILHKGYAAGGKDDSGFGLDEFWEYNPATDAWTQRANLPSARAGGIGLEYKNMGIVGFGISGDLGINRCDINVYDPAADNWTPIPHPLGCRSGNVFAFSSNDYLFIGQGSFRYSLGTVDQLYDLWSYQDLTLTVPKTALTSSMKIFPNPSGSQIHIEIGKTFSASGCKLRIINATGATVYLAPLNRQDYTFDSGSLSGKGIYFFILTNNDGRMMDTRKVVLE